MSNEQRVLTQLRERLNEIDRPTQLLANDLICNYRVPTGFCPQARQFSEFYKPKNRLLLTIHACAFAAGFYLLPWWLSLIVGYFVFRAWTVRLLDDYSAAKTDARGELDRANDDPVFKMYDELAAALKIKRSVLTYEVVKLIDEYARCSPENAVETAERKRVDEVNARWRAARPAVLMSEFMKKWALLYDTGMPEIADWLLKKQTGLNYRRVAGVYTICPDAPHPVADRWLTKAQQQPRARSQQRRGNTETETSNASHQQQRRPAQQEQTWSPPEVDHSFPSMNTNGIPMIQGTFVDVQGHPYGQSDM